MALAADSRLGPYEIVAPLGAGGMGEVYRARDTRLDRSVALKVLAPAIASDPAARGRFEREARAVAALDHPHICGIYDVGECDGTHFFVMPLLDGQTLAARLAKGPLPLAQALTIAAQIADALDKAHRQGIVHRDLKPTNIMLTKAGAKLLDFGLAKLRGPAGPVSLSGLTELATMTPDTAQGTILGTVPYMAPEQVEGKEADARSDIWALGAVLYEMLTGARPFQGGTPASVIGSILKDTPRRLTSVVPLAPPALERVVSICLSKDADARWQSAHDLRLELDGIGTSSEPAALAPTARRWPALTAAALAGLSAGALGLWAFRSPVTSGASEGPVVQAAARITNDPGFSEWPTWSPDRNLFAYSSNRDGNFEIHVRRVDAGEDVNVTRHAADDVQPAFSPDGTSIAFVSTRASRTGLVKTGTFIGFDTRTYGGDVWVVPALGGQARRVASDGNFPVWHPNGRSVAYVAGLENQHTILEVPVEGGQPITVLPASVAVWEILRLAYAPNGRWISFETADHEVFALPARGGTPTLLFRGSSHTWDPSGRRIYYVNQLPSGGTRIEAAVLNETVASLTAAGTVIAGVSVGTLKELALASDGQHLLAASVEESLNLTRVPLSPDGASVTGPEEALSHGQVRDRYAAISPDSARIAVGSNRIGTQELWVLDLPSRRWDRIAMPPAATGRISQACWARDGQHLVVMRYLEDGTSTYWHVALDGSTAEQLRPPAPAISGGFACAFSPDGKRIVYAHRAEAFNQLFVFDLETRNEHQLTTSASHKYEAAWSPDGRWLAFSAYAGGAIQAWRIATSGGDEQQLTSGFERNRHLFYSPDGRWLYVQPSHRNIWRMPADGGPLRQVTRFAESGLFLEEPTLSPDGRWLVYGRSGGGAALWMLTLGRDVKP